ncbi:alpha/beta fold hydrolase [Streptomyces sp. ISL-11]|uniref:alpha/beta fold hydrolase n=1 Tax=Streptomyces sp. ISL-11 TaxID=2819174 RepID=UPI0027E5767F|nr:alpha/beta fold hydrolase [Streptomyces sp. ISL-11]
MPVKDGELWAEDTGGDGLPLVLLHPGITDSRIWDPVMSRLTARHRVIRYDSRGFGRSPVATAPFSLVEDLTAVLDHLELSRAALVGSSMGGATALNLAVEAPGRVAALGLLCPGVTGYEELASPEVMAEIARLAQAGDKDGLLALVLRTWAAAGVDGDAEAVELVRPALPAWFSNYPYQVPDAPVFDRLGEVTAPSVLALGELDQPEVIRCNEDMAARLPGCRLVRLPDCDHLPTLRDPERCAELVQEVCEAAG